MAALPPESPRLKDGIRRWNPAMKTARGQSPFLCFTLLEGSDGHAGSPNLSFPIFFNFSFELSLPCVLCISVVC
ncbi:hypothetical protein JHK82_034307 [Glycine max]|nr:hypothetical protein JHK82_034307 [Glycine max]